MVANTFLTSKDQNSGLNLFNPVKNVQNELIIVKDAPHYGVMFDVDEVRNKVMHFLKKQFE